MEKLNTSCLIMAAGKSSRMIDSSLGQWKMDLPLDSDNPQKTILDFSLEHALAACQQVILVGGFQAQQLVDKYGANPAIKLVVNPDYQLGMASSIQCGLKAVAHEHCFISHGDMPFIAPEIYHQIWQFWQQSQTDVVFPQYLERSGHPVFITRSVFSTIAKLKMSTQQPVEKIRPILQQFASSYLQLEQCQATKAAKEGAALSGILLDVDTPKAYQKALDYYRDRYKLKS